MYFKLNMKIVYRQNLTHRKLKFSTGLTLASAKRLRTLVIPNLINAVIGTWFKAKLPSYEFSSIPTAFLGVLSESSSFLYCGRSCTVSLFPYTNRLATATFHLWAAASWNQYSGEKRNPNWSCSSFSLCPHSDPNLVLSISFLISSIKFVWPSYLFIIEV